jgi:hypothetical protein
MYHNLLHIGVKYVRDQLIMLPHMHVNWRSYESVRHLILLLLDQHYYCYQYDFDLRSYQDHQLNYSQKYYYYRKKIYGGTAGFGCW